jgi:hypothetical protein
MASKAAAAATKGAAANTKPATEAPVPTIAEQPIAPPPAAATEPIDNKTKSDKGDDGFQLLVKVRQGRNIRGSKGEKSSTFARVQFSDFASKDSPVVNDTAAPDYGLEYTQELDITEVSGDFVASRINDSKQSTCCSTEKSH